MDVGKVQLQRMLGPRGLLLTATSVLFTVPIHAVHHTDHVQRCQVYPLFCRPYVFWDWVFGIHACFFKTPLSSKKNTHTHTHITVFNQSHMCDKLKRCFMVRDGVARIVSRVAEVTCTATPLPGSKHCHGNQTSVRKSANIKVSLPE